MQRILLIPLILMLLVACQSTPRITPPGTKPSRMARKGAGQTPDPIRKSDRQRERSDGEIMREFDDDIAAWRKSYAVADAHLPLLESGLTRNAEAQYDLLARKAQGDNVPFAMVATTALAFANREKSASLLLKVAQESEHPRVVANALNGLGILVTRNPLARQEVTVDDVASYMADPRDDVRIAASFLATNLVQPGDDRGLLPYLTEGTTDQSYMVRANSCWALGQSRHPSACDLVKVALLGDPVPEVRCNAALALAATRDRAAVEPLLAALDDPTPEVQVHAASALTLLTGESMGTNAAAWASWWEEHRDTFQVKAEP